MSRDGTQVSLAIEDDGRGFDKSQVRTYAGHGLQNMEARARLLGGKLSVHGEAGKGTTVAVTVPIETVGGRGV